MAGGPRFESRSAISLLLLWESAEDLGQRYKGSGPIFTQVFSGALEEDAGLHASLPVQPYFRLSSFSLSDSIWALCPANSEAGGRVHSLYCSALIRSS